MILTVVLGGLLAGFKVGLKEKQDLSVELDTKKKILGAVTDISTIEDPKQILAMYDKRVSSMVVDINGEEVTKDKKGNALLAEKVNVAKNYKLDKEDRVYPVFMFMNEADPSKVEAYIFPMHGAGLWDWISGYIALESDLNQVKGVAFDHKQETPGLGARISSDAKVPARYQGKEIFDDSGNLKSITMVKGEGNTGLTEHQVDGLSGATMTAKGVNAMLEHYLECYTAFIDKVKSGNKVAIN